jgi:hypothetical protein
MKAIRRLKRKTEDDITTDNYLASKKFLSERIAQDIDVLRIDPEWDPRWQAELPPVNPCAFPLLVCPNFLVALSGPQEHKYQFHN